jgi:amino-acid N-acetyltransferase
MTSHQASAESIRLSAATDVDLVGVEQLLLVVDLPIAGLRDQFPHAYVVARDEAGRVWAVAGLEHYGDVGLLRSVAVDPLFRNAGIGRALVSDRLACAHGFQLSAVYLLTTTASDYFTRLGFRPAIRAAVPADLAVSAEFAGACPDTAICLAWRADAQPQ